MTQRDTVYKLMNIQPGEGKTVLLFVTYSLFMGVAVAVFYTCTTSLFLTSFTRSELPIAFIAGGVLIYGLGLAVRLLQRTISFVQLNRTLLAFLVVTVASMLMAPSQMHTKWLYFVLFLWNRVFVFINGITFWATASRIFNLQQAKRLFSFISMGDVISSVLSYFSVPILLRFVSTEKLLFISLISLFVCAGLLTVIMKRCHSQFTAVPSQAQTSGEAIADSEPLVDPPYYRLLYLLALLPVFGLVYVEFMFTVELKEVFPDKEIMAGFLGIFFGFCAIVEAAIKSFLYNRLISTYSIRTGIILLPLTLLFSYVVTAVYGSLYGTTSLFVAFVTLSRFFMSSVRKSINDPAYQVLFQPIPSIERTRLQSRIEGGPKALGNTLAGVLLLILTKFSAITLVHLSYLFLIVIGVWTYVAFQVRTEYRDMLQKAVAKSAALLQTLATRSPKAAISENSRRLSSNQSFDLMVQLAHSDSPEDRLRAALELGHSGRYYAYTHLLTLLQDEHPVVRKAALLAAGNLRKPELWARLLDHLVLEQYRNTAMTALVSIGEPVVPVLTRFFNNTDQSPDVQAHVVRLVNEIGGETALRFLRARINHPVQAVRDNVFEGLHKMRHRATVTERSHILLQLDEQLGFLVWLGAARLDLGDYSRQSALIQSLEAEKQLVVPKIFHLLAVLYGDDRFDVIGRLITEPNNELQGYLIELLNTTLPDEFKRKIVPLFADVPLAQKLSRCAVYYPQQRLSTEARLHDIINKDFNKITPRLKAIAIRELLNDFHTDPTTILVASAASANRLISETAFYVLHVRNPVRFAALHTALYPLADKTHYQTADRIAKGLTLDNLLIQQDELVRSEAATTQFAQTET
ncbi:hypothetical protein GK091_24220 [Spirosoma agri]|uniref:ADP,ATP carrier protein n=1 Tax=Spirosoma agri TaxID=1987381 RepID=A0A6M0INW3_9BACT|nr:HEAT repeat domain-containing protein [Spirosoma agri]NEU70009.1 hypothetical protein [Spirosoma agri]